MNEVTANPVVLANLKTEEVDTLDQVQVALWAEYHSGTLTTAQKIGALSEIRKVVQLRGLITGIVPVPTTGNGSESEG